MLIPATIRIGGVTYAIYQPKWSPLKGTFGAIYYSNQTIHIARCLPLSTKRLTKAQRSETFWHEMTHGILYDMGSPLYRDEKFVTAFALRLSKSINSARFA